MNITRNVFHYVLERLQSNTSVLKDNAKGKFIELRVSAFNRQASEVEMKF